MDKQFYLMRIIGLKFFSKDLEDPWKKKNYLKKSISSFGSNTKNWLVYLKSSPTFKKLFNGIVKWESGWIAPRAIIKIVACQHLFSEIKCKAKCLRFKYKLNKPSWLSACSQIFSV